MNKFDNFGDKHLTLNRTPKRDKFFFILSRSADHSLIWFTLALLRFVFTHNFFELIYFVAIIAIESALTNGPIKYLFRRKRPHENEKTYENVDKLPYGMRMPVTSSFPSGHATAAMCAAVLLSMNSLWVAIFVFPLGLSIAYSRMYTRMHHLSDVMAGLVLGLIYGYLAVHFSYLFM